MTNQAGFFWDDFHPSPLPAAAWPHFHDFGQEKVLNFLDVAGFWDPSLMFVMGCGMMVSFPAFYLAERFKRRCVLFNHGLAVVLFGWRWPCFSCWCSVF